MRRHSAVVEISDRNPVVGVCQCRRQTGELVHPGGIVEQDPAIPAVERRSLGSERLNITAVGVVLLRLQVVCGDALLGATTKSAASARTDPRHLVDQFWTPDQLNPPTKLPSRVRSTIFAPFFVLTGSSV
jgi:hypothetical protein